MREIDGTATISIKELDELRQREQMHRELVYWLLKLVKEIDTSEYDKRCEEIDKNDRIMTDEQLEDAMREAGKALKIIISDSVLRKLVFEYIDPEKDKSRYEIGEMSEEVFSAIPIILESSRQMSGSDTKEETGQQERGVCEMCEAYMADAECDMKEDCPAAGIVKRLKEAEEKIKVKEKTIKIKIETIKKRDEEIRELKKKLSDSELKRSYMIDPMAIGDRHEMGG